eukprot:6190403-Pleurochrysis_carterae.AAC.1
MAVGCAVGASAGSAGTREFVVGAAVPMGGRSYSACGKGSKGRGGKLGRDDAAASIVFSGARCDECCAA